MRDLITQKNPLNFDVFPVEMVARLVSVTPIRRYVDTSIRMSQFYDC